MRKLKKLEAWTLYRGSEGLELANTEEVNIFNTIIEVLAYITKNKIKRVYIYEAKRLGLEIIKALREAGYIDRSIDSLNTIYDGNFKYNVLGDKLYKIAYTSNGITTEIYDLFNITNQHLKKCLKGFNLGDEEDPYISRRIARVLDICLTNGLTHSTIASCAFAEYTSMVGNKFINYEIKTHREDHDKYSEDWRRSYKSGLVYVKKNNTFIKDAELHILDVNQLYPYVLSSDEILGKKIRYPSSEVYKVQRVDMKRFNQRVKDGDLFIAKIKVNGLKLKPKGFPFFTLNDNEHLMNGEIIYNYKEQTGEDEFETVINSVEFGMLNDEYDFKYEILTYWVFGELKPSETFGLYYNKWLTIRHNAEDEGNYAMATISKFMSNSLSGRFGLRSQLERVLYNDKGESEKKTINTGTNVSIPIASFFVSYAKRFLVACAKPYYLEGRLLYTDTDSMHIIGPLLPETISLMDSRRLGAFKDEVATKYIGATTAQYIQQKVYLLADSNGNLLKVTVAGLSEEGARWLVDNYKLTEPLTTITIPNGSICTRGRGLEAVTYTQDLVLDTHKDILTNNMMRKAISNIIAAL